MPSQFWEANVNAPGLGAGTALTNSTVLTDIGPAPLYVVPANYMYVGQRWKIRAYGIFSTTSTPTILLGVYYGGVAGTAIAATAANATITTGASWPWRLECDIFVRSVGSSGTVWANGKVDLGTSLTALTSYWIPSSQTQPVTISTTTANAWSIGAQWGTASASNTITCEDYIIELLN